MTGRRLTVQQSGKVGREEEPQLTHQQISELLETEGARSLVEAAEERGHVEATELEAFALEHELDDADVEQLTRELEAIGLEVNDPRSEEDAKPAQPEPKAPNPDVAIGSADSLQLFLADVGRHKLLTASEEVTLAKQIERGDPVAKRRMQNEFATRRQVGHKGRIWPTGLRAKT